MKKARLIRPPARRSPASTYCPKLWDEIGINPEGGVCACCSAAAQPFGNIHEGSLRRIWNSAAARKLRKDSLTGALGCYEHCHLLHKAALPRPPAGKSLEAPYEGLKILTLRFGELCNISCTMCAQDHRGRGVLDMADLRKLELAPFRGIELVGGEPLVMRQAREFFDYAAAKGKKVSFLSNGTLINDEWARKIARHSLFIYISINAATRRTHERVNIGSSWERVLNGVRSIRKYREAFQTGVIIQGHMTLVRENVKEAPLFIRTFKALGFDRVCFCHDESAVKYLHEDKKRTLALKEGVAAAYSASEHKRDIELLGFVPLFKAALQVHKRAGGGPPGTAGG